jgi:hypothetical protein
VVRGTVRIGRHARVEGSIKSERDMHIEDGAFYRRKCHPAPGISNWTPLPDSRTRGSEPAFGRFAPVVRLVLKASLPVLSRPRFSWIPAWLFSEPCGPEITERQAASLRFLRSHF